MNGPVETVVRPDQLDFLLEYLADGHKGERRSAEIGVDRRYLQLVLDGIEKVQAAIRAETSNVTYGIAPERLQQIIFAVGAPKRVNDIVNDACTSAEIPIEITEDAIAVTYREKSKELIGSTLCGCRMDGVRFLQETCNEQEKIVHLDEEKRNALFALQQEVAQIFGEKYAPAVYLLLNLLHGDITTLQEIIQAQAREWKKLQERGKVPEKHFLDHALGFIGMYADISQHVLTYSTNLLNPKARRYCRRVLRDIFRHRFLRSAVAVHGGSQQNLHTLLRRRYMEGNTDRRNMWYSGADLSKAPYNANLLGTLIAPNIPREGVAACHIALNNYHDILKRRQIQAVLDHYGRLGATGGRNARRALLARIKKLDEKYGLGIEQATAARAQQYREQAAGEHAKRDHTEQAEASGFLPLDDQMGYVRGHVPPELPDPMEQVRDPVSADDLLLRLIDPETILCNDDAAEEFKDLYTRLGQARKADKKQRPTEVPEHLGRSLQNVLYRNDPVLEAPCDKLWGYESIAFHLRELVLECFGKEVVLQGFDDERRPLFPPRDLDMLSGTREERAKDFNRAGVGRERGMLLRAGQAMRQVANYQQIIAFAGSRVDQYLDARAPDGSGLYTKAFSTTASLVFARFVERCFPDLHEGEEVIITDQEYDEVTSALTDKGVTLKPVQTNNYDRRHPKTAQELFEEIAKSVSGKTRMILISETTRLGDKIHELPMLLKRLKERFPDIPLVLDCCQSLGRSSAI